mmetsp:Transcript_16158/g.27891  ORF Transcript_16158/g.27891 Transcript_16158/m.27891 type:complete len:245 (-) Transcript_16158:1015-1749(-)
MAIVAKLQGDGGKNGLNIQIGGKGGPHDLWMPGYGPRHAVERLGTLDLHAVKELGDGEVQRNANDDVEGEGHGERAGRVVGRVGLRDGNTDGSGRGDVRRRGGKGREDRCTADGEPDQLGAEDAEEAIDDRGADGEEGEARADFEEVADAIAGDDSELEKEEHEDALEGPHEERLHLLEAGRTADPPDGQATEEEEDGLAEEDVLDGLLEAAAAAFFVGLRISGRLLFQKRVHDESNQNAGNLQ